MFNAPFNSISITSRQPMHLPMLSLSFSNQYRTIFFPRHWLFSRTTIVETMDMGKRGMNRSIVAMTTTNPLKEYWPSPGIEPCSNLLFSSPVHYQLSYAAQLPSTAGIIYQTKLSCNCPIMRKVFVNNVGIGENAGNNII